MNRKAGLMLLLVMPVAWSCGRSKVDGGAVAQAIQRELGTVALANDTGKNRDAGDAEAGIDVAAALERFYQSHEHQAVWFDESARPTPAAAALVEQLAHSRDHGLDPGAYAGVTLDDRSGGGKQALSSEERAQRLAARDVALSRAFLAYGSHLSGGRLDPRDIRVNWYANDQPADVLAALDRAVTAGAVQRELATLAPAVPAYSALRETLAAYRQLAEQGGWPEVPGEGTMKLGDQGVTVTMLRNRLAATGELAAMGGVGDAAPDSPDSIGAPFDEPLAQAVRAFQERHGLEPTGEVEAETRKALNVPVAERIRTIELNLERWRWLPPSLGERYLMVNVPAFELDAMEHDASVLRMRVVVGKPISQTPVLSDTMTHIVVNPFWNVPDSIANSEILPKIAKDPGFLDRDNFELDYDQQGKPRIRQRPGAKNALGKIKFMFPNHLNIYLHDTPADHLFARTERDFSHGCIRVEHPLVLARYVLRGDPEWTEPRLASLIGSGNTTDVKLPEQLPVHILYWTAWVDEAGRVQFRDDLYGKDKVLDQALRRAVRTPGPAAAVASS